MDSNEAGLMMYSNEEIMRKVEDFGKYKILYELERFNGMSEPVKMFPEGSDKNAVMLCVSLGLVEFDYKNSGLDFGAMTPNGNLVYLNILSKQNRKSKPAGYPKLVQNLNGMFVLASSRTIGMVVKVTNEENSAYKEGDMVYPYNSTFDDTVEWQECKPETVILIHQKRFFK